MQYRDGTAVHGASDFANPSPLALVWTQQSKMIHLLCSQNLKQDLELFPLFFETPILNDSKKTSLDHAPSF